MFQKSRDIQISRNKKEGDFAPKRWTNLGRDVKRFPIGRCEYVNNDPPLAEYCGYAEGLVYRFQPSLCHR